MPGKMHSTDDFIKTFYPLDFIAMRPTSTLGQLHLAEITPILVNCKRMANVGNPTVNRSLRPKCSQHGLSGTIDAQCMSGVMADPVSSHSILVACPGCPMMCRTSINALLYWQQSTEISVTSESGALPLESTVGPMIGTSTPCYVHRSIICTPALAMYAFTCWIALTHHLKIPGCSTCFDSTTTPGDSSRCQATPFCL